MDMGILFLLLVGLVIFAIVIAISVFIGYHLGRRSTASNQRAGFPVVVNQNMPK